MELKMKYRIQHKKDSNNKDTYRVQYKYKWYPVWYTETECVIGVYAVDEFDKTFNDIKWAKLHIEQMKRSKNKNKTVEVIE